jgi:hypothetical protein
MMENGRCSDPVALSPSPEDVGVGGQERSREKLMKRRTGLLIMSIKVILGIFFKEG